MIGIITPYKILNYGTKLQAYAMQELMGKYDEAVLLGFVSSSDYRIKSIMGKLWLKVIKKKGKTYPEQYLSKIRERNEAINSFDSYYKFGKKIKGNVSLKRELNNYNSIVCGSDQLWAPSNVIADYFTLSIIPKRINKFSYAASFGINEIPNGLRRRYIHFLKRLNYISVREHQGNVIIKDLIKKDVPVVLDPTLMLDKEEWDELAKESKIELSKPYIFCYFLGGSPEHRTFAKKLGECTGYEVVSIPHFKIWNEADENFGDKQLYDVSPLDFLKLIRDAEYVCTDSFHGTVFSVIFETQFAVFERFDKNDSASTNSRVYTLLENLGLVKQLYQEGNDIFEFTTKTIKYSEVKERLKELQRESFAYLDKVIG